jgi:hypothetical protein
MKKIEPILDNRGNQKCRHCGRTDQPYFGNVAPRHLVNYLLLEHASYLFEAVLKNINYLNQVDSIDDYILKKVKKNLGAHSFNKKDICCKCGMSRQYAKGFKRPCQ